MAGNRHERFDVGGGWMRPPIVALVTISTLIAVGVGALRLSTTHSTLSAIDVYETLALVVVVIVTVLVVTTFFSFVRKVQLTPDRVEFIIGSRRVRVNWTDLILPAYPYFLGINFRYRVNGTIQDRDPMFVTKDQARAILTHPCCPPSHLPDAVRTSLGLPAR
jgi:hypothetical protein